MPFCPTCHSEYRQAFVRCEDCNTSLVESLDLEVPPDHAGEALVTIDTFSNPAMASMLASLLESEGIQTFMDDAETISMDPLLSPALGGVKVQVRASDAEKGREIARRTPEKPVEVPGEPVISCPACNSPRTYKERFSTRAAFLSILLLGFPWLFRKGGMRCMACGHRWPGSPAPAPPGALPKEPDKDASP